MRPEKIEAILWDIRNQAHSGHAAIPPEYVRLLFNYIEWLEACRRVYGPHPVDKQDMEAILRGTKIK